VKAIMVQEIAFIHNPSFSAAGAESKILRTPGPLASANRRTGKAPSAVPAYFAALYETPLLSPEEEVDLFRRMNFLKFLANAKRSKLNPRRPEQKRVAEIEDLLAQARDVRNRIIEANLRLVVSIARRLAADHYPFDDIVSDGNLALVRGIEKFDFARGFRFSTYATHVIQRELYRQSGRRRDQGRKTIFGVDDWLSSTPDDSDPEQRHSQVFQRWQKLQPLMEQELTDREQDILAMRVGLDVEQGPQTLQSIGSKLGISKERVRQLERRAIERLQQAAEGFAAKFSGDDSLLTDLFVRES
jgi:RNA polymerase sigma factor (sigma-70 family)